MGIKTSREKIPPLLILCGKITLLKKMVPLNDMFKNEVSTEASHIFTSKTLKSFVPNSSYGTRRAGKKGGTLQHEECYLPLRFRPQTLYYSLQ